VNTLPLGTAGGALPAAHAVPGGSYAPHPPQGTPPAPVLGSAANAPGAYAAATPTNPNVRPQPVDTTARPIGRRKRGGGGLVALVVVLIAAAAAAGLFIGLRGAPGGVRARVARLLGRGGTGAGAVADGDGRGIPPGNLGRVATGPGVPTEAPGPRAPRPAGDAHRAGAANIAGAQGAAGGDLTTGGDLNSGSGAGIVGGAGDRPGAATAPGAAGLNPPLEAGAPSQGESANAGDERITPRGRVRVTAREPRDAGDRGAPRAGAPRAASSGVDPSAGQGSAGGRKPRRRGSAPTGETGLLTVICVPACDDVLDGTTSLGPSPVFKKVLPVGRHRVTLRIAEPRLEKVLDVEVIDEEPRVIREAMGRGHSDESP